MKDGSRGSIKDALDNAQFDIEHALGLYAVNFCTIPAEGLYDKGALAPLMEVIESCHIYLIGYTPRIQLASAEEGNGKLNIRFLVAEREHTVTYDLPEGLSLKHEDGMPYLEDPEGGKRWPNDADIQRRLCRQSEAVDFDVKYIGQAYGTDGARSAIDRLLKHETLQKIALKGVPNGYRLTLLLLAVEPSTQLFTFMNPRAKNKNNGPQRIKAGLDKLFNTNQEEQISLYEAALIRYFMPEYNIEFKKSFPSTKLKILQDCYEKDFSGVVAEISIDELPFRLFSSIVAPAWNHIAKYDLHKEKDRKAFFGFKYLAGSAQQIGKERHTFAPYQGR